MPIVNFLTALQSLTVLLACRGKNGVYLVRIVNSSARQRPALVMAKRLANLLSSSSITSR
jgi:hypothetical protein